MSTLLNTENEQKIIRILALDGGGMRGIYQIRLLQRLEEKFDFTFRDQCDLIAGTSIGSIIGVGLALGLTTPQIYDFLIKKGPKIFGGKFQRLLWWVPFLSGMEAWLVSRRLREALQELKVSEQPTMNDGEQLSEPLTSPAVFSLRFSECVPDVLVPVTNLNHYEPFEFISGRSHENESPVASDVVLASSAAPTFLHPHSFGDLSYVDGGLWANNPALCAYLYARQKEDPNCIIKVLSIGTGSRAFSNDWKKYRWRSWLTWMKPMVDILFATVSQSNDQTLNKILAKEDLLERIDPLGIANIGLDNHQKAIKLLPGKASTDATSTQILKKVQRWLS